MCVGLQSIACQKSLEWTGKADIVGSSIAGSKSDGFFVWEQLKDNVYPVPYRQMTLIVSKKVGSREKWSIQTHHGEFKRISSVALPSALKWIEAACNDLP
jgi:hypothetical protein